MPEEVALEIISSEVALGALERSEIDMQIATARRYPRSIGNFLKECESMISESHEIAESCTYKLKRRNKDGSMKVIEGPSIRLMEIALSAYGNLRFGARFIGIDNDFVTVEGWAMDVQRNNAGKVEIKRSIRGSTGTRYSQDMIMVTANAASSIAIRNALLRGIIPRAYINQLQTFAQKHAVGDAKSLPERLQKAFEYFTTVLGVEQSKVLAYLERPTMRDCTLEDLGTLQGLKTSLKDGEITMEEAFAAAEKKDDMPNIGGKPAAAVPTANLAENNPAAVAEPKPKLEPPKPEPKQETPPPAAATRTRKKKEEPAPAPEPKPEPPPAPPAPTFTPQELGQLVADKLQQRGATVDDFFDWLTSTMRDRKYAFDINSVDSILTLPEKLLRDLVANNYAELEICLNIYGNKP